MFETKRRMETVVRAVSDDTKEDIKKLRDEFFDNEKRAGDKMMQRLNEGTGKLLENYVDIVNSSCLGIKPLVHLFNTNLIASMVHTYMRNMYGDNVSKEKQTQICNELLKDVAKVIQEQIYGK